MKNEIEKTSKTIPPPLGGSDSDQILNLFSGALKNDGTLDLRSSYGRSIKAAREALDSNHIEAADRVVRDQIAILLVFQKAVECYALSTPDKIISGDGLNPLIKKDLFQIIELTRKSFRFLDDLRRRGKKDREGFDDLFDIE